MRGVRIPQDLNGQDELVLGLSVTSLAILLFGVLLAYTILHLPLPFPIGMVLAALLVVASAAFAWVRIEGRSLTHWVVAAIEFKLLERGHRPAAQARPQLSVLPALQAPAQSSDESDIDEVIELPDDRFPVEPHQPTEPIQRKEVPVYLGGPQTIVFYSLKGGTGRTTLATETAALLAHEGLYREATQAKPSRLKVLLADLDIRAANVSARIGLAQPTIFDFLTQASNPGVSVGDFILQHDRSHLEVLLGPPKSMSGAGTFGAKQLATILTTLKARGYHFIFVDIGPVLGEIERFLLQTADRVFCVVTPAASAIQDLYRTVELLRRQGLGGKLGYVANKMRDRCDLSEPLGDLGGQLAASVPYDPAFDLAENKHRPFVLDGNGLTRRALQQLASSVYPGLGTNESRPGLPPFRWLTGRRHAG